MVLLPPSFLAQCVVRFVNSLVVRLSIAAFDDPSRNRTTDFFLRLRCSRRSRFAGPSFLLFLVTKFAT